MSATGCDIDGAHMHTSIRIVCACAAGITKGFALARPSFPCQSVRRHSTDMAACGCMRKLILPFTLRPRSAFKWCRRVERIAIRERRHGEVTRFSARLADGLGRAKEFRQLTHETSARCCAGLKCGSDWKGCGIKT